MTLNVTAKRFLIPTILFLLVQASILLLMGRPAICTCGYVKVWESAVFSSGNSQHIFDWYSFSHVIHGFLFYLFTWIIFPKLSLKKRFLIAIGVEVGWEIWENTPFIINAYRQQALSQGYTGDSTINSVFDTVSMVLGFVIASKLPVKATVFIALLLEIGVGYVIRDNLTLNVLNFLYKFEFIQHWQSGA